MEDFDRDRKCEHCGKPFLATKSDDKFCNDKCRKRQKDRLTRKRRRGRQGTRSTLYDNLDNETLRKLEDIQEGR